MSDNFFQKQIEQLLKLDAAYANLEVTIKDIGTTGAKAYSDISKAQQDVITKNKEQQVLDKKIDQETTKAAREKIKLEKDIAAQKKRTAQEQRKNKKLTFEERVEKEKIAIKQREITKRVRETARQQSGLNKTTNTWGTALGSFATKFNSIGNIVGGIVTAGIQRATAAVKEFFRSSLQAADKQITSERQLLVALGNNERVQQRLIKFAGERQKVTVFGDEESLEAIRKFTAAGVDNEEQLKALLKVSQDLAAFEGVTLQKAVKKVTTAIATGSTSLEKYGVELESTNSVAQNVDITLQGLTDTVGGQAEVLATEGLGAWKQYKNAVGDTKEVVGGVILELTSGGIEQAARQQEDFNRVISDETIPAWNRAGLALGNTLIPGVKNFTSAVADAQDMQEQYNTRFDVYIEQLSKAGFEQEQLLAIQENSLDYYTQSPDKIHALNLIYSQYNDLLAQNIGLSEEENDKNTKKIDAYTLLTREISNLNKQLLVSITVNSGNVELIATELVLLKERKKAIDEVAKGFISMAEDNLTLEDALAESAAQMDLTFGAFEEGLKTMETLAPQSFDVAIESVSDFEQRYAEAMADIGDQTVSLIERLTGFNLAELLNMTPEQLDSLKSSVNLVLQELKGAFDQFIQNRIDQSKALIAGNDKEISNLEQKLESEKQLQAAGAANEVDTIQDKLDAEEKLRQINLQNLEKAQKQQLLIETATQAIAMSTAVANTINGFSNIPIVGVILGLAAAASLVAGFVAQKRAIEGATKAEHGDFRVLQGDRHSAPSGGIGVNGGVLAEGGEGQSIFTRNVTAKHGGAIERITKLVNKENPAAINALYAFDDIYHQKVPEFNMSFSSAKDNVMLEKIYHENKELRKMMKGMAYVYKDKVYTLDGDDHGSR